MKTAVAIAIILVVLSSFPLFGQQASATAQSNASLSAESARTGQNGLHATSTARTTGLASMPRVHGELLGHLDSKNAKTGDKVEVKTTEAFKTADGITIPKGSKLIGHVSRVQPLGSGNADAWLGLVFDRVELKRGESFAIHARIQCIAPSARALADAQIDRRDEMSAMNGSMVGGRPMSPVRPVGELAGGTLGGTASTATGVASGFRSTATGRLSEPANIAEHSSAELVDRIHTGAEATDGPDTHVSKLAGVTLESNASGNESGILSSSKHNVHLESGTQLLLAVAATASR